MRVRLIAAIVALSALLSSGANALPDVTPISISYHLTSKSFTSIIKNIGTSPIPPNVTLGVAYLVDGTKCTWGAVDNSRLAPGASVTIGSQGGPCTISNGTHTITVVADDVNRIQESNKNNNTLSATIIIGQQLPDLIGTSVSYNDTTHMFTSTAKNIGAVSTDGTTIGVAYLVDGVKCTWGAVDNFKLAPGASVVIGSQGGACLIASGTHTITAFVDDVNRILESNENNNMFSQVICVP